jgi:hypothetical protein
MAALLLRGELVLPVHARRTRGDHALHELEGVEDAAEAGLGVGHYRRHPVRGPGVTLGPGDLVGPQQRVVDAANHGRDRVGRVEALVRIRLTAEVGIRRDLPARQVDGLQTRLDLLHGLVACQGAQCVHVLFGLQQGPQPLCAEPGESVLLLYGAPQSNDVFGRIGPLDVLPSRVGVPLSPQLICSSLEAIFHFDSFGVLWALTSSLR